MATISGSNTLDYPNVRLVHTTKNNTPDEPVQLAFAVIDDTGGETIVTGQCPTAAQLFALLNDAGWLGRVNVRPIAMKRAS